MIPFKNTLKKVDIVIPVSPLWLTFWENNLKSAFKETGVRLRSGRDYVRLRDMASDRTRWRGLMEGGD